MPHVPSVLVIDDEPDNRIVCDAVLSRAGFTVISASSGAEGLSLLDRQQVSLVLLDVMMPGMSGWEVLREIRRSHRRLPVLMLTARNEESLRVLSFDLEADDHIVKPFGRRELVARIRAHLRRFPEDSGASGWTVSRGGLHLHRATRAVHGGGRETHLTPMEFDVLDWLTSHPDEVVTLDTLSQEVWDLPPGTRAEHIKSTIYTLRRKMGWSSADPIQAVDGGYRYAAVGVECQSVQSQLPGEYVEWRENCP